MSYTKKVGDTTYTILEPHEVKCNHYSLEKIPIQECVNPKGEYVEGYGITPVWVILSYKYRCMSCGTPFSPEEGKKLLERPGCGSSSMHLATMVGGIM